MGRGEGVRTMRKGRGAKSARIRIRRNPSPQPLSLRERGGERTMKLYLPLFLAAALAAPAAARPRSETPEQRVERVLSRTPVIDGHNDLPWEIRDGFDFWRKPLDLNADTSRLGHPLQPALPRLAKGHVGAQFWSVWIPATLKGDEAIRVTLEEIDIVHRMVERYPGRLELASTA